MKLLIYGGIDTTEGQSGSTITKWNNILNYNSYHEYNNENNIFNSYNFNEQHDKIIGIHVAGRRKDNVNYGSKITPMIQNWITKKTKPKKRIRNKWNVGDWLWYFHDELNTWIVCEIKYLSKTKSKIKIGYDTPGKKPATVEMDLFSENLSHFIYSKSLYCKILNNWKFRIELVDDAISYFDEIFQAHVHVPNCNYDIEAQRIAKRQYSFREWFKSEMTFGSPTKEYLHRIIENNNDEFELFLLCNYNKLHQMIKLQEDHSELLKDRLSNIKVKHKNFKNLVKIN